MTESCAGALSSQNQYKVLLTVSSRMTMLPFFVSETIKYCFGQWALAPSACDLIVEEWHKEMSWAYSGELRLRPSVVRSLPNAKCTIPRSVSAARINVNRPIIPNWSVTIPDGMFVTRPGERTGGQGRKTPHNKHTIACTICCIQLDNWDSHHQVAPEFLSFDDCCSVVSRFCPQETWDHLCYTRFYQTSLSSVMERRKQS